MTSGAHNDLRAHDKSPVKTERAALNTRSAEKIISVEMSSSKTVNPSRIYATEISRRLEALRQANGLTTPPAKPCSHSLQIQAVELVKQWGACYFLPMVFCTKKWHKDGFKTESGNEEAEVGDVSSLRCLSRPKKGLRLPLVFKKSKKLDLAFFGAHGSD